MPPLAVDPYHTSHFSLIHAAVLPAESFARVMAGLSAAFIAPAFSGSFARVAPRVQRAPKRRVRVPLPSPLFHTRLTTHASVARERTALQDVNEGVVRAVERVRGARVTPSDVAVASGLGVDAASTELVRLAALTGAAVDVTDAGDIAYRFRDVRARLRASSLRASLRMAWERAFPTLFSAVRVGFGALLILSILVTFLAIIALSAAASSKDDDRRDGGGFGMPSFRLFTPNIFDVLFYTRYQERYSRTYSREGESAGYGDQKPQMSFLEAVYSFVFGDGDPNVNAEERQWKAVAAVITANNGAVTAEQLRPFVLGAKPVMDGSLVDESDILPVLTRFGGRPEVTAEGNIIYVFPDFSSTAGSARRVEFAGRAASYLSEKEAQFSQAAPMQRVWTVALGVLNFIGVVTLGNLLASARALGPDSAALLALIGSVYPAIVAYAATFALVPLARYFWQRRRNAEVKSRNSVRMRAAAQLAAPVSSLRGKLESARRFRVEKRVVQSEDVVYSSDMDSAEVERRRQQEFIDDFDRKVEGR